MEFTDTERGSGIVLVCPMTGRGYSQGEATANQLCTCHSHTTPQRLVPEALFLRSRPPADDSYWTSFADVAD